MTNFPKNKKGGRPKKQENEKRNYRFIFRLNNNEKNFFLFEYNKFIKENNLKKTQFNMTDFVKHKIFSKDTQKIFKEKNLSNIVFEINKIGNNVNQIAKKINSNKNSSHNFSYDINNLLSKLNDIFKIISNL